MTLRQQIEARTRALTGWIVERTLARTPISAVGLTVVGAVLMLGAVVLIVWGELFWAGLVVLFASSFDMLDGALARVKGQVSRFGAFLDSTLDRYSETLIFLGLLLFYQRAAPQSAELVLAYVVVVGSLLTSYTRARAEALGFDCKVGLLERPERVVLIVLGLLTGWVHVMLWALAVLTHVTALQRLFHVLRQSRADEPKKHNTPLVQPHE